MSEKIRLTKAQREHLEDVAERSKYDRRTTVYCGYLPHRKLVDDYKFLAETRDSFDHGWAWLTDAGRAWLSTNPRKT